MTSEQHARRARGRRSGRGRRSRRTGPCRRRARVARRPAAAGRPARRGRTGRCRCRRAAAPRDHQPAASRRSSRRRKAMQRRTSATTRARAPADAVDQRAEQRPEHDRRQQVGQQHGDDRPGGAEAVVGEQRQRDVARPVPEAGLRVRGEEAPRGRFGQRRRGTSGGDRRPARRKRRGTSRDPQATCTSTKTPNSRMQSPTLKTLCSGSDAGVAKTSPRNCELRVRRATAS